MMTSRTEYRLLHRQDNADRRLVPIGYGLGLISRERYERVEEKYAAVDREVRRLEHTGTPPTPELAALLEERGEPPVKDGARLADLLRRPRLTYTDLSPFDPDRPALDPAVVSEAEIAIKYAGYIDRQLRQVEEVRRLEERPMPEDIDYLSIAGLRLEARQKLDAIRPKDLGQAGRVSGVSPADVAVLMVYLKQKERS
jgi:tRNA uridine 5-carboxymethylaminomethyl modification enzyme